MAIPTSPVETPVAIIWVDAMLGRKQQNTAPAIPADSPDTDEGQNRQSVHGGRLAWVPIVILLTVIGSLWFANLPAIQGTVSAITLGFAITTVISGFAACLLAKSFLIYGTPGLLPLGCGVVVWGLAGIAVTCVYPQDATLGATLHGVCACLSAFCHLAGALLLLRTRQPISQRVLWLSAVYTLAAAAVVGIGLIAAAGRTPSFLVTAIQPPGRILTVAVFIFSALLCGAGVARHNSTSPFVYWHALVPGLIAAGIFGALLQPSPGDVFDWTGHSLQFLGSLYMLLVAAAASQQEFRAKEITAEAALRKSNDLYHLLFENMTEGFFIGEVVYDKKGKPYDYRHLEANPACERQTGFKREQTMGKTSREVFFPCPTQIAIDKFCEAGAYGRASHFDFYSIVFRKHLDMYVLPCGKDKFGALFMDVSERKRMEDELRKLASVVTHSSEMVNLATLSGQMIYLNDAGVRMLGISPDEVAQTQILQVIPSHLMDKVQKEVLPAMMAGESWEGDLEYKNLKSAAVTPVHAMVFPVIDPKTGAPLYYTNVSLDITERIRMERALRELNATLESKVALRTAELQKRTRQLQQLTLQLSQAEDRERTRIGAILHEDFQQQIAAAKLHLSMLSKRTKGDPQQQEIIAKVDEILKDAIEQSRSLAHELSPAALSQNDLTEVLRWLAARTNEELGLRVRVDAQEGVILESDALTVFLFRAVQEMLRNVVKHAGATDATIRTNCHGQYVCISVRDQGRGFDPEDLGKTTGYGLMSIRERIEVLGGRLKIRSHRNSGTTLYLTVPNEAVSGADATLHKVAAQSR